MGGRGGASRTGTGGNQTTQYNAASAFARSLGITLNLQSFASANINPKYVMETLNAVKGIYDEFPVMKGKVSYIDANETSSRALASAGGDGGLHMGLYGRYSEAELQRSWQNCLDTYFHPQGTTSAGIFIHEMGHQMESYLNKRDYYNPWAWGSSADKIVLEAAQRINPSITTIHSTEVYHLARDISGYAVDRYSSRRMTWSTWETIAEAVDDYYENRERAKPLSKEIWSILKREVR